jgi:uncharacterized protein (TIGR01777 family)
MAPHVRAGADLFDRGASPVRMLMDEFVYRSSMPVSAAELFEWHVRPGALERLTPPWEGVRVVERVGSDRSGRLEEGMRVTLSVPFGPIRLNWVSRHTQVVPGEQFKDEQIAGPFARWVHTHRMIADGATSLLEDQVDYTPPLGTVGRMVAAEALQARLPRMFRFRHDTTRGDLLQHGRYAARPRLRVAITGASGLIGSQLVPFLTTGGHEVIRLVRHAPRADNEVEWSAKDGIINPERLGRIDSCIHLAGEGIASGRWTAARKAAIMRSRVEGTSSLAASLAKLSPPPAALLCASGKDFYGTQPGDMYETDGPGTGFLAEVCQAWEAAADPAVRAGIRVVHLRLGMVLTPAGGALAAMLPVFKLGAAGRLGSGTQPSSWVAIDDVIGAFHHAMQTESIWGPVNVTSPQQPTNAEFTATLARVLKRPAIVPAPAFALKLALGELSEALLLGSRVMPGRLLASGYEFRHADLEAALRHVLGRQEKAGGLVGG